MRQPCLSTELVDVGSSEGYNETKGELEQPAERGSPDPDPVT